MMLRVVWSPSALAQVARIFDYIHEHDPQAAERVARSLIEAGNSLTELPERGRPIAGTQMRELVAEYSCVIRYRVATDGVRILRVRHAARRPTEA